MERSEGLSDFLRENSRQAREYEELCIDLLCLQAVRIIFQTYSHLMVFLLVLFLLFLFSSGVDRRSLRLPLRRQSCAGLPLGGGPISADLAAAGPPLSSVRRPAFIGPAGGFRCGNLKPPFLLRRQKFNFVR